jgi:WD40 repeat protein
MVFSHDGSQIITAEMVRILIWDASTGAELVSIVHVASLRFDISLTFSSDGTCVIYTYLEQSGNNVRHVETWDITSAMKVAYTRLHLHPRCRLQSMLLLTSDGWIVDVSARKVLGKVPPIVSIRSWDASPSGQSVAFTTEDAQELHIMHFKSTTLTCPGTWDPTSIVLKDEGMA